MAQTILEEKVYCNATLYDIFFDNSVLLVLNKNSSNSDIEYNKETFSCMDTGIAGNHSDLSSLIVNDWCRDFTNWVETNQFINYRII